MNHATLQKYKVYFIFFFLGTLFNVITVNSQSESFIVIDSIHYTGQKRTKEKFLQREIGIYSGDTVFWEVNCPKIG